MAQAAEAILGMAYSRGEAQGDEKNGDPLFLTPQIELKNRAKGFSEGFWANPPCTGGLRGLEGLRGDLLI
jgi:hypothetical protein